MLCVAICFDDEKAESRTALFGAHSDYNLANLSLFALTAPIASSDGTTGIGDDPHLVGSFYCLDVEGLQEAKKLVEGDPFMGSVWRQVDYYLWSDPEGAWSSEGARPIGISPDDGCYIAAFCSPKLVEGALMAGTVAPLDTSGVVLRPLAALAVVHDQTIESVRQRLPDAEWVVAVPIAVGRWVGITDMSELAANVDDLSEFGVKIPGA